MSNNIKQEYIGKAAAEQHLSSRWWFQPQSSMSASIAAVVNAVEQQQSHDRVQNIKYARLYSNVELLGFLTGSRVQNNIDALSSNRVTVNVVKSCIDAAQSKIAKNKPKVQFLTEDGNFEQKQRAKRLTKYVEGVFYDTDIYTKAQKAFVHACVFGTGAIKVFNQGGRIRTEVVLPDELRIDDVEGAYQSPRQMHQVSYVSREVLVAEYGNESPEIQNALLNASTADISYKSSKYTADMLKVTESWHLPSGADTTDGLHTITIEGCVLFQEEYKKDYFPFVFFRWSDRIAGFFGRGIAEELIGIQIEINKILRNIQKAQHLVAVPRVAVDAQSKVSSQVLNNEIGAIFKYSGQPPQFFTPQAMNGEVYSHLKWLIGTAYEVVGISQLSATSKKPSGLDAAVALREYQDIETERFMITAQRYERMFLDLAAIVIDQSRDMFLEDKGLSIKLTDSKFIETIKWAEVNLPDESFTMKMMPTSLLPGTPAGRLQKVQELINAGFIDKEQALSLLDFPDLKSVETLEMASLRLTERQLCDITEHGKYEEPEPTQNAPLCLKLAQQEYLKAKLNKLPEERLELLLRYMDDAERLIEQTQAATVEAPQEAAPLPTVDTAPLATQ